MYSMGMYRWNADVALKLLFIGSNYAPTSMIQRDTVLVMYYVYN